MSKSMAILIGVSIYIVGIILIILLSPVILIAGFLSGIILLCIVIVVLNIPIGIVKEIAKQVKKWRKNVEDLKNIQK